MLPPTSAPKGREDVLRAAAARKDGHAEQSERHIGADGDARAPSAEHEAGEGDEKDLQRDGHGRDGDADERARSDERGKQRDEGEVARLPFGKHGHASPAAPTRIPISPA